jgi:hypothetical protein
VNVTAWWCISGENLLDALRRVADGDSPEAVYRELLEEAAFPAEMFEEEQ